MTIALRNASLLFAKLL